MNYLITSLVAVLFSSSLFANDGIFIDPMISPDDYELTDDEKQLCIDISRVAGRIQMQRKLDNTLTLEEFKKNYAGEYGPDKHLVFAIAEKVFVISSVPWENPELVASSLHAQCVSVHTKLGKKRRGA